jgi:hypothetical protein
VPGSGTLRQSWAGVQALNDAHAAEATGKRRQDFKRPLRGVRSFS